jgi:hypothetical protein
MHVVMAKLIGAYLLLFVADARETVWSFNKDVVETFSCTIFAASNDASLTS